MRSPLHPLVFGLASLAALASPGDEIPLDQQVERYLKRLVADAEPQRPLPKSAAEWRRQTSRLREEFLRRLGDLPQERGTLQPVVVRRIEKSDYTIEVLYFRSRPGVYVTGALHLPKAPPGTKAPAVLSLMGHQESPFNPSVQLRSLAVVKQGIACLAIDPFGSAQRSIQTQIPKQQQLNDAHGGRPGFALAALGAPLMGIEVYDHMRALDYLQSRPEINPGKLGVMGVSGGGSHAQWLMTADSRLKAVINVHSVGAVVDFKEAYTWPHCACENLPGGLRWSTAIANKAMAAPNAFMQIICTDPGVTNTVERCADLQAKAQPYFDLMGAPIQFKSVVDPQPHGYNKVGLEYTAGFMKQWLRGEGDGRPIPQPKIAVEPTEDLLAFPEHKRPADFLTLPAFTFQRAKELAARLPPPPRNRPEWSALRAHWKPALRQALGPLPAPGPLTWKVSLQKQQGGAGEARIVLNSEPGLDLPSTWKAPLDGPPRRPTVIVLHPEGKAAVPVRALCEQLAAVGWNTFAVDLRDTGETWWPMENAHGNYLALRDYVAYVISVWLDRPLLGMWAWDIRRAVDYVAQHENADPAQIAVIGFGDTGLAALLAAGEDPRVTTVVTIASLASFVSPNGFGNPWRKWTEGPCLPFRNVAAFVPNLFWKVADWPQLAAFVAPRRLLVVNPEGGDKQPLAAAESERVFGWTRAIYEMLDAGAGFEVKTGFDLAGLGACLPPAKVVSLPAKENPQ